VDEIVYVDGGLATISSQGGSPSEIDVGHPELGYTSEPLFFDGGNRLAFERVWGGNRMTEPKVAVFVLNSDGSSFPLTSNAAVLDRISLVGSLGSVKVVVLQRLQLSGNYEIRVFDVVSRTWSRLGKGTEFAAAPDEKRFALVASRAQGSEIQIGNIDTAVRRHLAFGLDVRWSETGRWIAFRTHRDGELYVIRPNGTGRRQLTHIQARASKCRRLFAKRVVWRPGTNQALLWIIDVRHGCANVAEGRFELRLVSVPRGRILKRYSDLSDPAWSPDGRRFVAVRDAAGRSSALVVVDVQKNVVRTITECHCTSPRWRPDR
jgi:dipeptidyl aminopeptidase/acylaminoacyl peptidase